MEHKHHKYNSSYFTIMHEFQEFHKFDWDQCAKHYYCYSASSSISLHFITTSTRELSTEFNPLTGSFNMI